MRVHTIAFDEAVDEYIMSFKTKYRIIGYMQDRYAVEIKKRMFDEYEQAIFDDGNQVFVTAKFAYFFHAVPRKDIVMSFSTVEEAKKAIDVSIKTSSAREGKDGRTDHERSFIPIEYP